MDTAFRENREMSENKEELVVKNIVFVGDGAVGKTSILYAYSNQGEFRISYVPTIFDRDETELTLDNVKHLVKLHDTAGQEDFERLRKIVYKEADCFVLCYSISDRKSFNNISNKWEPELRPYKKPIVLVGTKSDLTVGINIVQEEEGERLKRKINANQFLECSSKHNENINEVIYEAIRAAVVGPPEPPETSCCTSILKWFRCFNDE
ncbi:ras-like GTP-binding protein RhoL [Contarinia nasturtii]|uniref:ras-like GTP-binding protein RhoL n=1 Tax=Contarinia nasturtii TaxID=265458 RepID=UPI0012D43BA3|nr:ras-like GTP-binding protein RhoL [Contarinia nasturtii]